MITAAHNVCIFTEQCDTTLELGQFNSSSSSPAEVILTMSTRILRASSQIGCHSIAVVVARLHRPSTTDIPVVKHGR